jgi:hypothetical protein
MRNSAVASATRAIAIFIVAVAVSVLAFAGSRAAPKAESAKLTPAQWAKITKRMETAGGTRVLPAKVAQHLGVAKGAEAFAVHELAFEREGY